MSYNPVVDSQRHFTFTAVGFSIALLALVVALAGWYRSSQIAAVTQAEVLVLNKRIQEQNSTQTVIPRGAAENAGK